MGKDLLTGTYVYKTLAQTYKNFLNPAMKIKVGGKDLKDSLKVGITNATITLSEETASSADFAIVNVYDLKSSSFISSVMSAIKLGETITVELGYGSAFTEVFCGYIDSIDMEFSGMPVITVKALDIRRLMMQNIRMFTYKEKKASDIVTEILKVYGKYIKTDIKATKDTATKEKPLKYVQKTNDLEFIQKLGKQTKMEFLVIGGKAVFREMHTTSSSSMMTLERGNGLISFSSCKSYCEETIKIYGHDEKTNKDVVVQQNVSSDKNAAKKLTKKPVKEIRVSDIDDKTIAENVAAYEMSQLLEKRQTGSGTCIGLPELVPGRYLEIAKLDKEVNKEYYLKQVVHTFSTEGFITNFTVGSWK